MAAPCILIEAAPVRAADGVAETVRLAGGGGQFPYFYGNQHWRAGVVQLPTFITAINFEGGDFGEGGVPQAAELQWAATTKSDLSGMAGYFWIDAPITVRIGDENASGTLPPVKLTGKVLSSTVDGGTLKIQLSDPVADMKKPLLTDRFGGTGGLDGPVEWAGKIKHRVWGRVWNKAGEPIDKANNIYSFADPGRPIQAFDAVRDKGAPAAALTVLGWQGSMAATLAALRSAAVTRGGGVACPSIACVKWWTQPAGELTADLRGEVGSGYVETTADIVARIVSAGPVTPFATGTIAAAVTARPAPVGWVANDDSTTVAAMIEELLGNSSLLWLLNAAGEIVLREWTWGGPATSATSYAVKRTATFRPVATRTLGFRRNERQMARGEIVGIVFAEDLLLADGRTGEALVAQLDDVQALADASAAQIESAADDGVLDRKEKSSILVPRDATLEAVWSYLDAQAAIAGASVASARSTAAAARVAWQVYRNSLSPTWNNDTLDTAIVRATFVGKLNDYDFALDLLADALRQYAGTTASWPGVSGPRRPEDNSTRNDDGANMLFAPHDPAGWGFANGAALANLGTGRPLLANSAQLTGAFHQVFWSTGRRIQVTPGDVLWFRHTVSRDAFVSSGTDNVRGGLLRFNSAGSQLPDGTDIPGSAISASELTPGQYVTRYGKVTIPEGVAFVQTYSVRIGSSGGSFYVAEPFLNRFEPAATAGAAIGVNLVGSDGGVFAPPATNLLYNSRFEAGLNGWALYYNSGTSLSLTSSGRLRVSWPTPAAGWTGGSFGPMDNSAIRVGRRLFRVLPGQRFAARVRSTVSGSCNRANAYCRFLNQAVTTEITGFWASNVLSTGPESSGYGDVPSGAYWLEMELYGITDGLTGAGAFEIEAISLWEIPANQTVVPAFSDGPSSIYRADVTGSSIAAGYANQTSTENAIFRGNQNRVFNSEFKYALAGWGGSAFSPYNDWLGSFVSAPIGTGGVQVLVSTKPINCGPNQPMTLAATFRGDASVNQFLFVDVEWRNGGNNAVIGYSSTAANQVYWSNIAIGASRKSQSFNSFSATDGSGFVKAFVRIVTSSDVAVTYGELLATRIQLESGSVATQYNAAADDGAVLSNTTGQIPDGRNLNASNVFGLRGLSVPPAITDSVSGGNCYLNLTTSTYSGDWGGDVTYPAASGLGPVSYATTYYVWRNVSGAADAGSSYGYSTAITAALGTGKVYLGSIPTRANSGAGGSTGTAPGTSVPGGGGGGGGPGYNIP